MWTDLDDGTEVELSITYEPYRPATRYGPEEGEFYIDTIYGANGERMYVELTDSELARFEREYVEWMGRFSDY